MDANKSNSQFPVPGIALVLVALGIFVYSDNPFNSTRPDSSSSIQSTAEDVRARLWQDPFDAVQKHRESFDSKLETVNSISDSARSANDFVYQDDTFDAKNKAHSYGELGCRINKDTSIEEQLCEYKLASRLHSVIDEIRSIKDGPFSSITQHPLFSANAMPFGGVGGLYLIDYMTNLGM